MRGWSLLLCWTNLTEVLKLSMTGVVILKVTLKVVGVSAVREVEGCGLKEWRMRVSMGHWA